MSDRPQLEVKHVIVCDDIRREDNGKEILIGVYSGGIVVPSFPAPLALSFWMQFSASEAAENIPVEFRVVGENEDVQFARMSAGMRVGKAGLGSIGLGAVPVMLQIPTTLRLQMKQYDSDWKTVYEIAVEKGAVSLGPIIGQASAPGLPQGALRESVPT